MADLHFREAVPADIEELLLDLRPEDRAEADALLGPGAADQAARDSFKNSVMCWTACDDRGVVFVFGLGMLSALGGEGGPWMLGTTRTHLYPRELVRQGRLYIARMLVACPFLANAVDVRNTRSIAWLRRLGFTILPPQPMGPAGAMFHPFYMESSNDHSHHGA